MVTSPEEKRQSHAKVKRPLLYASLGDCPKNQLAMSSSDSQVHPQYRPAGDLVQGTVRIN